ncbi:uncharacterized protein PG998_008302 [Apiospora kogelbergensis]
MVLGLTDRELELLALSHRCMETKPDINFKKLADHTGYKNTRSIANIWNKIYDKLDEAIDAKSDTEGNANPKGSKAKAVPGAGGKRKKKDTTENGGDDDVAAAPAKRRRGKKVEKTAKMEDDE